MMTMAEVLETCREIGVEPVSGPHGVRVGSTGWRLECGGGIAGNAGTWWLRVIAGAYHPSAPDANAEPIGPIVNRAELRRELRRKWPSLHSAEKRAAQSR